MYFIHYQNEKREGESEGVRPIMKESIPYTRTPQLHNGQ